MTKKFGGDRDKIAETCGAMQWKSVARNPRPRSAMQRPVVPFAEPGGKQTPIQEWSLLHAWAARIPVSLFRAWCVRAKEELCQSSR